MKSISHKFKGRFKLAINSSHLSSFSDFFGSILGAFSVVGLLRTSALDFDLANPSLALEIKPHMSPKRFGFSSVGLCKIDWLASFCVKSTKMSNQNCWINLRATDLWRCFPFSVASKCFVRSRLIPPTLPGFASFAWSTVSPQIQADSQRLSKELNLFYLVFCSVDYYR